MSTSEDASLSVSFGSEDLLLEVLLSVVENAGLETQIALYTGGGTIIGTLIKTDTWVEAWTAKVQAARPEVGLGILLQSAFEEATGGRVSRLGSGFLHLRDATYRNGPMTMSAPLWRGTISQISGWSLEASFQVST
ncbi:hypothetical protein ACFV16_33850 [Streptomyces massasporeus]|uniref:hypothetical protein n=1 Tax=Streptomyces massasporeus TaxID=67324 RepID=UPI003689ACBF